MRALLQRLWARLRAHKHKPKMKRVKEYFILVAYSYTTAQDTSGFGNIRITSTGNSVPSEESYQWVKDQVHKFISASTTNKHPIKPDIVILNISVLGSRVVLKEVEK